MTSREVEKFRLDWKSLLLPVVLILTGALILTVAGYGLVSLDRVQNLWPAALILVGLADLFTEGPSTDEGRHE
jgi:hypothetical protein